MSDTIIVTAPPLSNATVAYLAPSSMPSIPNQSQIVHMYLRPYYQGVQFCQESFTRLVSHLAKKDYSRLAAELNICAFGEKNIVNVFNNFGNKLGVYDAIHGPHQNPPSNFVFKRDATKELTGGSLTPMAALSYYLFGNGEERFIKIENIGLNIKPFDIPPIMTIINSGQTGVFQINERFNRDTSIDGIIPGSYLGNITLKTEGVLTIQYNGVWNYNGVIKAFNDVYDANPSNHRGPVGENATTILRIMQGTPYPISIPGQLPANYNGIR